MAAKANASVVLQQLSAKPDADVVSAALACKANRSAVEAELRGKADAAVVVAHTAEVVGKARSPRRTSRRAAYLRERLHVLRERFRHRVFQHAVRGLSLIDHRVRPKQTGCEW